MDLLKSITHPDEVLALLKYKIGGGPTKSKQNLVSLIVHYKSHWFGLRQHNFCFYLLS